MEVRLSAYNIACVYVLLKSLYLRQLIALIYDVHEVSVAV